MQFLKVLLSTCFLLLSATSFAVELPTEAYTPFVNEDLDLTPRATNVNSNLPNFPVVGLRAGGENSLTSCTEDSDEGCTLCCFNEYCADCMSLPDDQQEACLLECNTDNTTCINACEGGGSLPLNGSEWFMLVLAFMYGSYLTYKHKFAIN